jgi:hypothetical protein
MRLLLVEDDEMIGRAMRQGLADAGFTVDWSWSISRRPEVRCGISQPEPGQAWAAGTKNVKMQSFAQTPVSGSPAPRRLLAPSRRCRGLLLPQLL